MYLEKKWLNWKLKYPNSYESSKNTSCKYLLTYLLIKRLLNKLNKKFYLKKSENVNVNN